MYRFDKHFFAFHTYQHMPVLTNCLDQLRCRSLQPRESIRNPCVTLDINIESPSFVYDLHEIFVELFTFLLYLQTNASTFYVIFLAQKIISPNYLVFIAQRNHETNNTYFLPLILNLVKFKLLTIKCLIL